MFIRARLWLNTDAMTNKINRRSFLSSTTAGALAGPSLLALAQAPQVLTHQAVRPLVISAANGNVSKDVEGLTCVARAFKLITAGADVLEAVVAAPRDCRLWEEYQRRRCLSRLRPDESGSESRCGRCGLAAGSHEWPCLGALR